MRTLRSASRGPIGQRPQKGTNQWGHPDGFPLDDVKVGDLYDGYVTNARMSVGIFVHFGAVKDGLLRVPSKVRRHYFPGMEVNRMEVLHINHRTNRVVLRPDPNSYPDEHSRSMSRGRRSGLPDGRRRDRSSSSKNRGQPNYHHPEGMPIEEVQVGSQWEDKMVTQAGSFGVFIDFGCVRDGRLNLTRSLAYRFKAGDRIPVCLVEAVSPLAGRIELSVPDPFELAESIASSRVPLDSLRLYDYANGCINNANKFGIFVNIGAEKDARMDIRKNNAGQYLPGQQIQVQIVAIDLDRGYVTVVPVDAGQSGFEEEEEESLEEEEQPEPLSQPPPARALPANDAASGWPESAGRQERSGPSEPRIRAPQPQLRPNPQPVGSGTYRSRAGPEAGAGRPSERQLQPPLPMEEDTDDISWPAEAAQALGEVPLESLRVGENVDGTITGVADGGLTISVKIHGVSGVGLLTVEKPCDFMDGDEVQGMMVRGVDRQRQQVILFMDDPELSQEGVGSEALSDEDDRSHSNSPPRQDSPMLSAPKQRAVPRPKTAERGLPSKPRTRAAPPARHG